MFSNFRRNQRVGVALLIFVAIMAFIVAPILQQYLESQQRQASGADDTLVSYSGGEITRDSLDRFQFLHHRTVAFLTELAQRVQEEGGQPRVPNFFMDPRTGQIIPGISPFVTPESAVETILHSRRAESMGLTLDDDTITQWLALYTDSKVSGAEVQKLLSDVSQGQMGRSQLYEHLKTHLQADLLNRVARTGLEVGQTQLATPGQLWHEFQKLNQTATIAAYPVLVDQFLDQVDAPSDAEIEELYEQHKDDFPSPDSPEPGFRRRFAANVEYVAARMSDFIERQADEIDEETLRAEYQRRVEEGRYEVDASQFPAEQTQQTDEPANQEPATEEPASDAPASEGDQDSVTVPDESSAETTDRAAAEQDATAPPAEGETAPRETVTETGTASDPETPSTDAPADASDDATGTEAVEETTEPAEESSDAPADDTDDQQSALPVGAVRLVNFLQQDQTDASGQDDEPAADLAAEGDSADVQQPAVVMESTEPGTPQSAESDEPQPQETPADDTEQPSDEAAAQPEESPREPPATSDAAGQPTEESDQPEQPAEPEQRTLSFEEVRDQLARELARPLASAQMQSALQEVQSTMLSYFVKRDQYEKLRGEDPSLEMPEKPNLQAMAEERGLVHGVTGLQDALSIADQEIASSRGGEGRGDQFAALVYNNENPLYAPLRTTDGFSTDYVFWKTDEQPAYVPSLEEAREEVVAALKLRAARELAKQRAQALAERAASSDEPLVEVVPEENRQLVLESVGPFSWMMSFGQFSQPMITNVPDLDRVGDRFMQEVFAAEPGEVVVAPNEPATVYYVVKVQRMSPSDEELREQFLQPAQRQMAQPLIRNKAIDIYTSWYRSVEEQLNVQRGESLE